MNVSLMYSNDPVHPYWVCEDGEIVKVFRTYPEALACYLDYSDYGAVVLLEQEVRK